MSLQEKLLAGRAGGNGKTSSSRPPRDPTGMTRVVVTHTPEAALLPAADHGILVLEKRAVLAESGSFDELMRRKRGNFTALFSVPSRRGESRINDAVKKNHSGPIPPKAEFSMDKMRVPC